MPIFYNFLPTFHGDDDPCSVLQGCLVAASASIIFIGPAVLEAHDTIKTKAREEEKKKEATAVVKAGKALQEIGQALEEAGRAFE